MKQSFPAVWMSRLIACELSERGSFCSPLLQVYLLHLGNCIASLSIICFFGSPQPASQPTWSRKAVMAARLLFKCIFSCLLVIFTSFVWKSGHGGAPLSKYPSLGSFPRGVGYSCYPSRGQRPLRCALLFGFTRSYPVSPNQSWHRIDSVVGKAAMARSLSTIPSPKPRAT